MKFLRHLAQYLTFAVASLLALPSSFTRAAEDAKTGTPQHAPNELAALGDGHTDTSSGAVEQQQRIAQLQRRIDEEREQHEKQREKVNAEVRKKRAARTSNDGSNHENGSVVSTQSPIIRTEIRLLTPNADGDFDVLAAPTLITQAGQETSLSSGAFAIGLRSSVDEQNNITTSAELTIVGPDGEPSKKIQLPSVKNRPGVRSTVSVENGPTVEMVATLVDPKSISVDFPGGSLADFLVALSKSGSEPFNMIAPSDALALTVPQLSVRNVSPHNLALALDQLLVGYLIDFPKGEYEREGTPIFTIRADPSHRTEPKPERPKPERFMSYPINRYVLNQIPINQVIEAINTAWTLDPAHKSEDLKLKYHAATGILLVSSREESALKTADQVIGSLREQAEFLEHLASQPAPVITPKP